jgi:plastocyanin
MRKNPIRVLALAMLAVVTGFTAAARAENDRVVKGTVHLPPDTGSVRDVVVSLEGHIGTPTPRKVVIDQKDLTFIPHVVAVAVGSTVEFLNNDTVPHNVFSTSAAKQFDLGIFERGESRTVTVDRPGVIDLRCNVHPKMHAFVLVLENNYFAMPDEHGDFEISGIPAGRYKLRAWHETFSPVETWVNLDDAKIRTVELRFQK